MIKTKLLLNAQPLVRVQYIGSPQRSIHRPPSGYIFKIAILGVFLIGGLSGAGLVAHQQLSSAKLDHVPAGQVLGAVTVEPGTTEQWSMPLEFSEEELNIVADMLPQLIEQARHEPTPEELANIKRKEELKKFFQGWKSPFAKDDATLDAFLSSKNMKLMIAISFVESSMGKKCYANNCSGIGGTPPNLRKYKSYADWIRDFDSLLERRYKGLPIEKFMGLYVQPGSPNWLAGVKQILGELERKGIE